MQSFLSTPPARRAARRKDTEVPIDGPPDEFGQEMAPEARVWKTYVREADKWDKELMDGRNKFITGSIGDLKPNPAESSAQTLLIMSQTLAAIANGQNATLPATNSVDTAQFTPSHAAVVVNTLWLLSLSLSVAVSLIAMLAKDWCYNFMSNRSGQSYHQARKRQKRWNGMERWKMKEVLTYLPGFLHIAFCCFARNSSD
ncbi:hypothetical protein FRC07_006241 [Ceratobasidium sp. 392]|nr:hypothetical protein FRC07_006241 [Ceratobasidium sp. 392]